MAWCPFHATADASPATSNAPSATADVFHCVFHLSAQTSIIREAPNRDYYVKKRAEGCKHVPAAIALGRRRVDVW